MDVVGYGQGDLILGDLSHIVELNNTLIIVAPKVDSDVSLKQFIPILFVWRLLQSCY